MAQVIIYIDGFNLYYGAVRKTPCKWLDLSKLCARMLPQDQILEIKYFTAKVSGRPNDPDIHNPTRKIFTGPKNHSKPRNNSWPFCDSP